MTEEIKKTRELQGGIRKRGYKCSGSDTVILSMIDKRKLFEGEISYWKMEMNFEYRAFLFRIDKFIDSCRNFSNIII